MMKKIMFTLLCVLTVILASGLYFINTPQFGRAPKGQRLERIMKSPNFKDGVFINREPIVNHLEDSFLVSFYKFCFYRNECHYIWDMTFCNQVVARKSLFCIK